MTKERVYAALFYEKENQVTLVIKIGEEYIEHSGKKYSNKYIFSIL